MLNYHRLRFFLLLVGQFLFIGIAALANEYKISILVESQVFTGKTLFVDVSKKMKQTIVEVDTHGKILWQHTPAIPNRALLLDVSYLNNDHILYTAKGYGVIEIDRSGKIIWKHLDTEASHDADRLPNGNTIYNRGWVSKGEDVVREKLPLKSSIQIHCSDTSSAIDCSHVGVNEPDPTAHCNSR